MYNQQPQYQQPVQPQMVQGQTQNQMETTTGIYRGKLWKRTTNTGKQQYQVTFSPEQAPEKNFSFTAYDSTKGFNEMQEGQVYKIGFVVAAPFTNKAGQTVTNSKTALFFGVPEGQTQAPVQQQFAPQPQPTQNFQGVNTNQYNQPQQPVMQTPSSPDINMFVAQAKQEGKSKEETLGRYLLMYKSSTSTVQQFNQLWG